VSGLRQPSDRSPPSELRRAAGTDHDAHWVALGYVAGTHGLRGDIRIKQHNPDSELLFELEQVALRAHGQLTTYELASVRNAQKGLLVHLLGVDSIEAAEKLRGAELCVPRSALPELAPGEFYHVDLEGLAVCDAAGQQVGVVERVCDYPASRVVRVRGPQGVWEVPMIDPYLLKVDVPGAKIVVDRLEDIEPERDAKP
jgi:16S rRNA processing protein RimM